MCVTQVQCKPPRATRIVSMDEPRPTGNEEEQESRHMPGARECALLLLLLIESRNREREKPMTRIRLAEVTLKRLWGRARLAEGFLKEVGDWLLIAGWAI